MREKETIQSEQVARCDSLHREPQESILAVAVSKAEELLQVIQEEAAILKRLDNQALMAILPRKELLIRELVDKITILKHKSDESQTIHEDPAYSRLKGCLADIDRINRSNQVFIESSLAYFDDFLDCICPSNYGRGQEGLLRHKPANFKGLSFRKEI